MPNRAKAEAQNPVGQQQGLHAEWLSPDQAFQRLTRQLSSPGRARHRLNELFRTDLQLWGRRVSGPWFAVPNSPTFFDHHLLVEARRGPDGWHAELAMQAGKLGVDGFMETEWAVVGKDFEALLQQESGRETPKGSKRGPK